MTYSEVILGSSPFIFSPQFGHRTRLYELDFKNQPENIAKILNKSYQLGVNQFLFNVTDDIKKALEISENMGCTWSVIGMTNFNTFNEDLNVFDKFNTTTVILDGSFVDKKIDEGDFEYIIKYLKEIKNRGYIPAIETRTPFKNLPLISESNLCEYFDVIMFPLNFYGYMMDCNFLNKENKNKISFSVEKIGKKIIVNRTLATGILKPQEAYDFIKNIDYVDCVCVGLAKESEAEETLGIINKFKL